jgi:hypothetical protein
MAFALHRDHSGAAWLVDVAGVRQLIRSYVRSAALARRSQLVADTQALGPMGTFKLTTFTIQTDYSGVTSDINNQSLPILKDFDVKLRTSGKKAFDFLVLKRNETVNLNNAFREKQLDASMRTSDAVNRVQGNIEWWKNKVTLVRDASADFLMVGATFLSGGTAVAVLGGASFLKGSFTFEDKKLAGTSTGNAVAAGTIEASTDLIVGAISLGTGPAIKTAIATKSASSAVGAGVLVVMGAQIDATSEFAKAVIDGKSVRQGLIAAGTRAGIDLVSAGIGSSLDAAFSSAKLARLSFPITITRSSTETESLTKLALNTGGALGEDKVVSIAGENSTENPAAWHNSLACTYLPLGNSDLAYVESHAMKRAGNSPQLLHPRSSPSI